MNEKYAFDRPVIILAAPRSGSTLLFETLSRCDDFWTIGGESHGIFESINRFNPLMGYCNSNALRADDATPRVIGQIRSAFRSELRNADGLLLRHAEDSGGMRPRLLEKTPKNALRVSLLNAVFPDALYVYLYRNPRDNVSSIMDAWQSGRFVTYPSLLGREGPWSLLLPPGWESHNHSPPEEVAAFQWRSANTAILEELARLGRDRWIAVSYEQQVHDAANTIERICRFSGVSSNKVLDYLAKDGPHLSRYTLTAPQSGKWRKNEDALRRVLPELEATLDYIREIATELPAGEFDMAFDSRPNDVSAEDGPCYCGSGRNYHHCHGLTGRQGIET